MVRSHLLSEHADVFPNATIWLRFVLPQGRLPTRDQHGHHIQVCDDLSSHTSVGRVLVYCIPGNHHVATASGLWLKVVSKNKKSPISSGFFYLIRRPCLLFVSHSISLSSVSDQATLLFNILRFTFLSARIKGVISDQMDKVQSTLPTSALIGY